MQAISIVLSFFLMFSLSACKRADMKISKSDDPGFIEVSVGDYTCLVPSDKLGRLTGPVEQHEDNPYFIVDLEWQDDPSLFHQYSFDTWNVRAEIHPAKNPSEIDSDQYFSYPSEQVGDSYEFITDSGLQVELKGAGFCSTPDRLRLEEMQVAQISWLTEQEMGKIYCRSVFRRLGDHPFSCNGSGLEEYASVVLYLHLTHDGDCHDELVAIAEYVHEKLNEVAGYQCWDNRESLEHD